MARPKSPERNVVTRSFRQPGRFLHLISAAVRLSLGRSVRRPPVTDVSSIEHADSHEASSGDATPGTGLPIVIDGQVVGGTGAIFDTPEHDVQLPVPLLRR